MENLNKRTLTTDPQYFGGYLNSARHNIFTISNYIAERINPLMKKGKLSIRKDDDEIADSFICTKIIEKPNLFFTNLVRFLPIVKVYDSDKLPKAEKEKPSSEGIDFETLADDMKICFKELNGFRNDYSHYFSKETGTERKIVIDERLSVFLRTNYQRAIEYTKIRFKDVYEESHFKIAADKILVNESNVITQDGLVFFTCLFLDRENAFHFINRIIGFKDTRTLGFRATREVFSAYCVTLPHDKFTSDDEKQGFILDLLNELNKCPKELYDNITEEERKIFRPDVSESIDKITESSIPEDLAFEDYDEYIQSIITKKRKSDRFPYFAIKYLDGKKDFDINFHLNLGKVELLSRKKKFLGEEVDRDIVEDVKVFGKLAEYTNEKEVSRKLGLEFQLFNPHYQIENNKMGISFSPKLCSVKSENDKPNLKLNPPDAFLSVHELPKIVLAELFEKGKAKEIIESFIGINKDKILNREFIEEVKSKLVFEKPFYRSFQSKRGAAYNDKGLQILKERKTKLNEILREYNLNDRQIPERILDYWLNINDVKSESEIANRIKAMKKDCRDRVKAKAKNKAPKAGEMATYLAKDIVDMVIDEKVKQKITSFYYDKMQECLALYGDDGKKQIFIKMCGEELNLFDKEKGHPFLFDLNLQSIKKTSEFYEKYLIKKAKEKQDIWNAKTKKNQKVETNWLYVSFYVKVWNEEKKKMETKIQLPKDLSRIPFSIRNLAKEKSTLDKWLMNVSKGFVEKDKAKPVDLPTNIFDDTLVSILRERLNGKKILFKETDRFSRLLELWCNDTQPFYSAERLYNVYEKPVKFKLGDKKSFKEYFKEIIEKVYSEKDAERKSEKGKPPIQKKDILTVFNDAITENEKVIRFYQTKDRVMLFMINDLIGKDLDISLKEISPVLEKSPLNVEEEIKQRVEGKLSYDGEGNFISKKERTQDISRIITDRRKRKDFTVLKKFTFDKRLPELFEYYTEEEVPHEKLKTELEEYNQYREMVFDRIFELEKKIIAKGVLKEMKGTGKSNVQHEPYLNWLREKGLIDEKQYGFLKVMRNSFSHNQYPPKVVVEKNLDLKEGKITSQIFKKYDEEITGILEKLQRL